MTERPGRKALTMTDHLQEARDVLERLKKLDAADHAAKAIAHALIAIAEKLDHTNVGEKLAAMGHGSPDEARLMPPLHENCLKKGVEPGSIHVSNGLCCTELPKAIADREEKT